MCLKPYPYIYTHITQPTSALLYYVRMSMSIEFNQAYVSNVCRRYGYYGYHKMAATLRSFKTSPSSPCFMAVAIRSCSCSGFVTSVCSDSIMRLLMGVTFFSNTLLLSSIDLSTQRGRQKRIEDYMERTQLTLPERLSIL